MSVEKTFVHAYNYHVSDTLDQVLTRGVTNIIPSKKMLEEAAEKKHKLNVYLGIDPTAPRIHLGHAVPLIKLQKFAELGHNVTLVIGDFTALIGDTSDKDSERPNLSKEEIQNNFETYKEQASKILDFSLVRVVHNSEWLSKLDFAEIIKLCQHFSFGDFASRELIKKRLSEGKKVGLHEALYPVMQGYDSYHLDTDLQIGGADQTFNMQAGRILQEDLRGKESFVLATDYLTGTDGRKMSKSWGNAIWLDDTSREMFGKIMSIKDDLIVEYFTLVTRVSHEKIDDYEKDLKEGENPRDIKKKLAYEIVSELFGDKEAQDAQEHFEKVIQNRDFEYEDLVVKAEQKRERNIVDFLIEIDPSQSRSRYKDLVTQGGVSYDEKVVNLKTDIKPMEGKKLKIGKKYYVIK